MSEAGSERAPKLFDPWLIVATLIGFATAVLILLGTSFPRSRITWMLGAAVVAFSVTMYLNPRHWLKRRSATCLGIAGACAAFPTVAVQLDVSAGFVSFSSSASP